MTVNKSISCFSNLFHTFNIINAFVFILCKIFLTQAHSSTQSINDLYSAFDLLPIRLWNGWPLKSKVESFNKKSKLVKTFEVTRHWKTSCSYLGTSMCNASVAVSSSFPRETALPFAGMERQTKWTKMKRLSNGVYSFGGTLSWTIHHHLCNPFSFKWAL